MGYEEFKQELIKRIKRKLGEGHNVEIQKFYKINTPIQEGVTITKGQETSSFVSNIEPEFKKYKETEDMEYVVVTLLERYNNQWGNRKLNMVAVQDWNYANRFVKRCIINKERNKALLDSIPYKEFLDLVIIYYLELHIESIGDVDCKIDNKLIELWGITSNQLDETATENEKLYAPFYLEPLDSIIREFSISSDMSDMQAHTDVGAEALECRCPKGISQVYILSNKKRNRAAVGIVNVEILRDHANRWDSDLYILLSSIHEAIIISSREVKNIESLIKMLSAFNETCIEKQDFLSDDIYVFSREKEEVIKCEENNN